MHLILGEERVNSAEAERLYVEMFHSRRTRSRHFEDQMKIVHFYLFSYLLIKYIRSFRFPLFVTPGFLKPLLQNRDLTLAHAWSHDAAEGVPNYL
jgi:hypothetical protein